MRRVFMGIIDGMKREHETLRRSDPRAMTPWALFASPVVEATAPDYRFWVSEREEMWLLKIRQKAAAGQYADEAAFLGDVRRVRDNALAYNMPGHGRNGAPFVIPYAENMVLMAQRKLAE